MITLHTDGRSYICPDSCPTQTHRAGDSGVVMRPARHVRKKDMIYIKEMSERVMRVEVIDSGLHPRNREGRVRGS